MAKKNTEPKDGNARQKILDTAAEIFARNGFDGARVDEIASEAGVNKALIYYYFESKEKLLEELLEKNINEIMAYKEKYWKNIHEFDIAKMNQYSDEGLALLKEKGEILKIAIIEALKGNKNDNSLFKMIDLSFSSLMPKMETLGFNISKKTDLLTTGFFFGLAPVLFYITLGEKWAEFHNIDNDEFKGIFQTKLKEIYMDYTFKLMNELRPHD